MFKDTYSYIILRIFRYWNYRWESNRTRTERTELEPTFWEEPNRTRTDVVKSFETRTEPISVMNPNLLTQVLVGFDKLVD